MRRPLVLALPLALWLELGCSSAPLNVAPAPPERREALGSARGRACGTLVLGYSPVAFIPIALNSRVERAYDRAVASVSGARALVDVKLDETWFWWLLGLTRCTTITGEAIP